MKKYLIFILSILIALSIFNKKIIFRTYDSVRNHVRSTDNLKLYVLKDGQCIQDITEKIIKNPSIPYELKKPLIDGRRHIVIFKYKSDGLEVAGSLSYLTDGPHPVAILLRGGNGRFGIMRPNNRFSFIKETNVISTLYRGNLYQGDDGFGGEDIHDVENLVRFIPNLERKINISLTGPYSMIGVSRGAMQMFGALAHSTYLREKIKNVISISGNVDLHFSYNNRREMKFLFDGKQKNHSSFKTIKDWINYRDPVVLSKSLPKNIRVGLFYGLNDNRVAIQEQENFLSALSNEGIEASLLLYPNENHGLSKNINQVNEDIFNFLKGESGV
jgi:dipeptidyl aminopeptidase/acylaminoacyl peptidase